MFQALLVALSSAEAHGSRALFGKSHQPLLLRCITASSKQALLFCEWMTSWLIYIAAWMWRLPGSPQSLQLACFALAIGPHAHCVMLKLCC
jgi:hypothetical protein